MQRHTEQQAQPVTGYSHPSSSDGTVGHTPNQLRRDQVRRRSRRVRSVLRAQVLALMLVPACLALLAWQAPAAAERQYSSVRWVSGSGTPQHTATAADGMNPQTATPTPTAPRDEYTPTATPTPTPTEPDGSDIQTLTPTPTSTMHPLPTTIFELPATPATTPTASPTPTSLPPGVFASPTSVTGTPDFSSLPPTPGTVDWEPAQLDRQLPPLLTPTLPPPAPTAIPISGDPHVAHTATTASCAGCHRAHTSQGPELRQSWPEEGVCFACHAEAGPGTNVEPAFTQYANTGTRYFTHDVAATAGVHRLDQTEGGDFGGTNRHVECEDCHEPHYATRGEASAPAIQREMNLVAGVDPVWSEPGAPVAFSWLPQAEREYQVCFKCHSSFTNLPSYAPDGWDGETYVPDGLPKLTSLNPDQVPDQRDMAQEFNPHSASFHPVTAVGRNQSIPPGSFVPGWSAASLVYCSDCHTSAGQGPHGSPLLHLLDGSSDYQTANSDDPAYTGTEICFKCHDAADYIGTGRETNFRRGNRNLHKQHTDNGSCYLCHDSHGSEQLHLLNLDLSITADPETYLLPGYDSQTYWQISADDTEKTCLLVCHGHDHSNSPYPNYGD